MNRFSLAVLWISVALCGRMWSQVPDSTVTVASIASARSSLIDMVWGEPGIPMQSLPSVTVLAPAQAEWTEVVKEMGLTNNQAFEQVEKLSFEGPGGFRNVGYLFVAKGSPNRLVIVHQGHSCRFDDPGLGLQGLIKTLLMKGYSVATLYMPRPDHCTNPDIIPFHNKLFATFPKSQPGSALQLFVAPAVQTVNYALNQLKYARVDMIGLSGGAWTTTLYAALDPRIRLSVPTAGTRPRSIPGDCGLNPDDKEQASIPSYLNLYALGSTTAGRRQIQVLNKFDSCCFQVACPVRGKGTMNLEREIREYEKVTQAADQRLGGGSFRVYVDANSHAHQISSTVTNQVIVPALSAP
ncbi:hypothetical protein ACFPT7_19115 [Acidicapsa dinghuensis]|uniref:Uncharacterized protein n=1 Tax=Acidicapsa dinghuensis TaxID=2218256 RepID=A0ABW1EJR5_9BACT|nr:hypothetical protein [Acidicapsa dinghuensis]